MEHLILTVHSEFQFKSKLNYCNSQLWGLVTALLRLLHLTCTNRSKLLTGKSVLFILSCQSWENEICVKVFPLRELLLNNVLYTCKVDVWSTGCVFAELCSCDNQFLLRLITANSCRSSKYSAHQHLKISLTSTHPVKDSSGTHRCNPDP